MFAQSIRRLVVAYSGGVDSHVLLHLMTSVAPALELELQAVHVHHGLSAFADDWVLHCQTVCAELNVPFDTVKVHAHPKSGESPEAAARHARYEALAKFIDAPDVALLTAHHQDDQAETVLLQLMRGAGVKGLSGMPRVKCFAKGQMIRPILHYSQDDILAYAKHHDLKWIDDHSNDDLSFDRNFLRHEVLPLLSTRREGVVSAIKRSAAHCAEAANLLDEFAALDLEVVKTDDPNHLSIPALETLSPARQRNVLRYWLLQRELPLPSAKILEEMQNAVIAAGLDAKPRLTWATVVCTRPSNQYLSVTSV